MAMDTSNALDLGEGAPETPAEDMRGEEWSRGRRGYRFVKRVFDIVFSAAVIMVGIVPGFVLCVLVAFDTHGTPFYSQERIGMGGTPFRILKFRTMVVDSDDVEKHLNAEQLEQWKQERKVNDDPRITSLGCKLRATSLDELPQFINVLRGDMSIVGPRPHMLQHTEQYSKLINKYMVRHLIKPGITGWAQVTGYRGETHSLSQMEGRVRRDIWYLENWSLLLDIRIIFMTVWNALRQDENAY